MRCGVAIMGTDLRTIVARIARDFDILAAAKWNQSCGVKVGAELSAEYDVGQKTEPGFGDSRYQ